jgi:hypothetical protein
MKPVLWLLLFTAFWPWQVFACRCEEPGPRTAYARADSVVMFKVTTVATLPGDVTRADGEVLQAWKSSVPRALSIYSGEDCLYPMTRGATYLLYLKRSKEGEYGTYRCRGNRDQAKAADRIHWLDSHGQPVTVP